MKLYDDITALKGVGVKTSALFNRVGVFSLWDLLMYLPRDYEVFPEKRDLNGTSPGEITAVLLTVKTEPKVQYFKRISLLSLVAVDSNDNAIVLKWFNSLFLKNLLHPGMKRVFYGKINPGRDRMEMEHPKFFSEEEYEKIQGVMQPVYPLTKGLSVKTVSSAVKNALENADIRDFLSEEELLSLKLPDLKSAIRAVHFPEEKDSALKARKRLSFNEFLLFMERIREIKERRGDDNNGVVLMETAGAVRVMESLPYSLTAAQKRAYESIMEDMSSGRVMNRLLQGDTGSGKTIVAFLAMITAAENGHQAALMAPTEVLASQHAEKLKKLLSSAGLELKTVLLTGALPAKEKREARSEIKEGVAKLVIGTHALIEESVEFKDLALAITDEQHRFGVRQREELSKGKKPHVLVMSATPIPRTLSIILYGDLDISVMDEMPGNRLPIKNCVVGTTYRKSAYDFIRKEVEKGHQAYVICPMVEESEAVEAENVTDYSLKLKKLYGEKIRVGMLNGRMKSREKNEIMERFSSHDLDILVSTTVVEVGVDVPNATVMLIENAERFGLSSLHQIRGRVGRGGTQGYCIFMDTSGKPGENKRLNILKDSNDGFKIADEDLKLRGPGDVFGIRQSGEMDFLVADIYNDSDMLRLSSEFIKKMKPESRKSLMEYVKNTDKKVVL